MPLDTNIALGVKPVEQPNMLAQMGQMMQLRQAQQEYESQNALRDVFSQGANISDPAAFKKIAAINPKLAFELRGKQLEQHQKGVETLGKEYDNAKIGLTNVTDENGYYNWVKSSFNNPAIAAHLTQLGITPEKALANAQATVAKEGLSTAIAKSSMGIGKFIEQDRQLQNSVKTAQISAAPGHRQASVAEQKFDLEKKQQAEIDALFGKPSSVAPTTAPMGGGGGKVPNALAPNAAPAPTNMLVPSAQAPVAAPIAATPVGDVYDQIKALDAKIAPLVNTGNPRASAIVQQLIAQRNALMQSAKQQYGGSLVPMEIIDPATNRPTVVQGRLNQRGVLEPVEMAPVPLSTDANATGGENISPTVARPAPTPDVLKERQAVEKLPEAIAMNTDAIRKIDELIGSENGKVNPHPGLSKATGLGGGVMRFFSGTEGKNFEIRHKEVLSQAFLDAFETLKGGGAITEKEGEKATSARTRMDLAQSKEEYIDAAREYQGVLKRGVENARARMQRSGIAPTTGSPADPLGIR